MALEQLVEALQHQAEAEAAAILSSARTEAAALRSRSEADLTARRGALGAALEADRRSAVEVALASARHAARREVLEARNRLLERVFAAARTQFPDALQRPEYRATLPAQIAEALECLGKRDGTLHCHPALHQELERLLGARAGLRLFPDPAIGPGFKVVSQDGAVEIDGTLDDRLVRLATRVAVRVFAKLEAAP
jgi:vacuolar-type H+-ATPase subunit E/Vma4